MQIKASNKSYKVRTTRPCFLQLHNSISKSEAGHRTFCEALYVKVVLCGTMKGSVIISLKVTSQCFPLRLNSESPSAASLLRQADALPGLLDAT